MIFRKQGEDVGSVKLVKVVCEYGALAKPLTIELAPKSLSPAGVGYRKVQTVFFAAMPIFCGYIMTERIFIVVRCNSRVTRCAEVRA